MIDQITQLINIGGYTYRDLCGLEISDRNRHYEALVKLKEEEKKREEKAMGRHSPGSYRLPQMPSINRFKPPRIR